MSDFVTGFIIGYAIGALLVWIAWDFFIAPPLREIAKNYLAHLAQEKKALEAKLVELREKTVVKC